MTRARIEESHHKAFVQFLNTSMGQLPELAFFKHTKNEVDGSGPRVTRHDRKTGKIVSIPLSIIIGGQLGVRAGVWDFEYLGENRSSTGNKGQHGPGSYAGLAIEFKAPGRTLTTEQRIWREHYVRNGWRTEIFFHWVPASIYVVAWVGGNPNNFLFT
jgi:hypothetical protein